MDSVCGSPLVTHKDTGLCLLSGEDSRLGSLFLDLTTQWVSVLQHAHVDSGSTVSNAAFEQQRCPASPGCLLHLLTLLLVWFLYPSGSSKLHNRVDPAQQN